MNGLITMLDTLSFRGSLLFFALFAVLTALPALLFSRSRLPLRRYAFLIWLTVSYAFLTFFQLGSLKCPESTYQSSRSNEEVVLQIDDGSSFDRIYTASLEGDIPAGTNRCRVYYHNIRIAGSSDLQNWEEFAVLDQNSYLKWDISECGEKDYRYLRLTFSEASILTEIGLYDSQKERFLPLSVCSAPSAEEAAKLIDEQDTLTADPDYRHETFFDEIYHARNAYEIAHDLPLYTAVHPLLGTRFIALGIKLFGMNPFGYRFFGALTSVLLVPVMYALAYVLFRKERAANLAALLFACDFMHYTTGRIATLEPFSVLFILLMYLFMALFRRTEIYKRPFLALLWLFLSGLSMALAWSVKWTAIYASVGLAFIFFEHLFRCWRKENGEEKTAVTLMIIICCFFFFVLLPMAVYFLCYVGIRIYDEQPRSLLEHLWQVCDYIRYDFTYHAGLEDTHPYSSTWYMWLIDLRPIWYYVKYCGDSIRSISCFNNPLISFGGLAAVILLPYTAKKNGRFFLLPFAAWLSLLLPWVFVPRTAFAYHYYPCIPFLILLIVDMFAAIGEESSRKTAVTVFLSLTILLFIAYLPVTGGLLSSRFYVTKVLAAVRGWWYFGG